MYTPHFDGGRRRGVFEVLAATPSQIRPDETLRREFFFNLSYSATQSAKYWHRND
jgi:hypothetical protein